MRIILAFIASICFICSAYAIDYPTKPVRIFVGWAPGGVADVAARVVAHKLSEKWGQQVIVENRPGANGMIANDVAARAVPDGYTLMLATSPEVTTTPFIHKNAPKYFADSFVPVILVTVNPMVLMATSNGPYKTVKDLVDAAKEKPGEIPFSSAGVGSAPHLAGEMFAEVTGIKLKHVPYKGGSPAAVAVAGGEVPIGFAAMAGAVPLVKSGRVRVLGLTTAHRVASENWPTLAEEGVPNFNYTVWTGLFIQKGAPADIVRKLDTDFRAVLAQADVSKQFEAFGAVPGDESLAEFVERIKRDSRANEEIVRKAGIHVD